MKHEEHQIQCAIVNLLHYALPPDACFWAVPNGEKRGGKTIERNGKKIPLSAIRLKKEGVKSGVADVLILWAGRLIALEVKTPKGRQSENQKAWEAECVASGGVYHIVRSVDEAREFLAALIPTFKARMGSRQGRELEKGHNEIDDWLKGESSTEAKAGRRGNKAA